MTPAPFAHRHDWLAAALTAPLTPRPRWLGRAHLSTLLEAADPEGVRPLIVERLLALDDQRLLAIDDQRLLALDDQRRLPIDNQRRLAVNDQRVPIEEDRQAQLDTDDRLLDETTIRALRDRALREDAHALVLTRELSRVIGALTEAGVTSIVFKGAATAEQLFARAALRPRDDADLLIDPGHRTHAGAVLERLGYHWVPANEHPLAIRQSLYRRRDGAGVLHNLDLHWRISNRQRHTHAFSVRSLRLRARPLAALGPAAFAPGPIDALLIACLHLIAHHARSPRLIWLYEIDRMLGALDDADRQQLPARARALGLEGELAAAVAESTARFDTAACALESLTLRTARTGGGRIGDWLDDLRTLPSADERLRYLTAQLVPSARYLRAQPDAAGHSLGWLYLRRLVRGLKHLGRR